MVLDVGQCLLAALLALLCVLQAAWCAPGCSKGQFVRPALQAGLGDALPALLGMPASRASGMRCAEMFVPKIGDTHLTVLAEFSAPASGVGGAASFR